MTDFSPEIALKKLVTEQLVLLWRRKWLAVGIVWLVCLIGWPVVVTAPRTFEADARVFVDVDGLLTPLLRGLIVEDNNARQIGFVRQTLLSRPNVEQIAHLAGLDLNKSPQEITATVDNLSQQIRLFGAGDNLFRVAYSNKDPEVARDVVESVVTVFSENAASSNRVEMENAQQFLDRQIAEYEQQLRDAEARRAEFRREYSEYLPNAETGVSRLSSLEQSVSQLNQQYQNALSNRSALQNQLSQVPQFIEQDYAPTVAPDGQLVGASVYARLAQAREQLSQLRQQYTDLHPNVIAQLRIVETLEAQAEDQGLEDNVGQGGSRVLNPVYEQIRIRLVDVDVAAQTTLNELNNARAELERVRQLFRERPDIEAMSIDLDRDYEILRGNYEELLRRRESALLSQAAEDQADRTQFRVIDPPFVPQSPSSPNIPLGLSLVLFVALGSGLGLPLGYEFLRGTYSSTSGLKELGLPVIGSVTFVNPPGKERSLLSGMTGPAVTLVSLFLLYGVLVFVGGSLSMGFTWA